MYAFLKNKKIRVALGIVLGILLILIVYYLRTIFIPFFIGLLISYMLNPVVTGLEHRGVNRTLSITFLFVVMFALFFIVITMAAPAVFRQGKDFIIAIAGDEFDDINNNDTYEPDEDILTYDRNRDGEYTKPLLQKFNKWVLQVTSKFSDTFTESSKTKDSIQKVLSSIEQSYKTVTDQMLENIGQYVKNFLKNT